MKFKNLFLDSPSSSRCSAVGALLGMGMVTDLFGTMATNENNYLINAKNNEFNAKEAYKTRKWNEKLIRQERAYNDPNAVRERLERAGVNPNFADLGTGEASSVTGGATAQAASPIPMQAPRFNIGQALETYSRVKSMEADSSLKAEQAKLINAQGVNQEAQNEYVHQQKQLELINLAGDYRQKAAQAGLSDSQKRYYEKMADTVEQQIRFNNDTWDDRVKAYRNQNANIEADTNLKIKQAALTTTQNAIAEIERKYKIRFSEAELSAIEETVNEGYQRIENLKKDGKLTDANVKKVAKETAKLAAEKTSIDNNNRAFPMFLREMESRIYNNYGSGLFGRAEYNRTSGRLPIPATSNGATSSW